jgi:DNA-3-methyladenine glycosylase II
MTSDGLSFSVEEALAHLKQADPVLWRLIEFAGPYQPAHREDPYGSLLRTILFQQLAGAAAMAIQRRWLALYGIEPPATPQSSLLKTPSPQQIAATTDEQFRSAGVSRQKAGYMRDLALHVLDGRLDLAALPSLPDEAVIEQITAVKGLGEWSAHMFLMFHLGRPDVLPVGDLGVRHGMRIAYGLPEIPTPARAREIGAPWAPFRSVGSWYMWRANEATAAFV